eukprot:9231225-Pyramimonas_sp.AAC.1
MLEVFAGRGRLSAAALDAGLHVAAPVDNNRGPHMDILDGRVFALLRRWIRKRKLWYIHFGTPCTFWSQATSTSRGKHARTGELCAQRTLALLRLCCRHNVRWSLEDPASSRIWKWEPLQTFLSGNYHATVRYDCCAHGSTYIKPTVIVADIDDLLL